MKSSLGRLLEVRLLVGVLVLFALVACTTSLKREGYTVGKTRPIRGACELPVKFQANVPTENKTVLGKAWAGEPGMGTTCGQDYVLELFQEDACELKADFINIVEEHHPNFWSTCYRARAEFVALKKKTKLVTDARYSPEEIQKSVLKGEELTKQAISAGVAGGAAGALIVAPK